MDFPMNMRNTGALLPSPPSPTWKYPFIARGSYLYKGVTSSCPDGQRTLCM